MDPVAQPAAASAAAPPPPPPAAAAPAAAGAPPPAAPAAGAVAAPAAQSPEPPKPAAPAAAPAKIEVKLRDGVKIDEKVLDEFRTIVSNEKLSPQERAQALIDLQFRAQDGNVKAVEAAITTQRNADLEALKADPQFGGARFEQTRNDARSVMKQFFGEKGSKLLELYGLDCHPDFTIPLARIRALIKEDTVTGTADGKGPAGEPDAIERMFPKSGKQMKQEYAAARK